MEKWIQQCRQHQVYPDSDFCHGEPDNYCVRRCQDAKDGEQCALPSSHTLGEAATPHKHVRNPEQTCFWCRRQSNLTWGGRHWYCPSHMAEAMGQEERSQRRSMGDKEFETMGKISV